jgi:glutathione S-transferase
MSLTLYFHPLSSYCQKALIAFYENDVRYEPHVLDLMNPAVRAEYHKIWPIGKMPVLRDSSRGTTIAEASVVIEYLQAFYPGKVRLVPDDPERAIAVRQWDRFYDLYVNDPVGKVVTDRLRPAGKHDELGVEQARERLVTAYDMIERALSTQTWAAGDDFSMADCAAAPSLYYANLLIPFAERYPQTSAYFARLMERPSFVRAVQEAEPYRRLFPDQNKN